MGEGTVHKFERAGLGKAPFHFIRFETRVGPIRYPDGTEVGAPGQAMGTCDYCGTGIADCYVIRSSDGQEFIVGSTCVGKTGDKGLVNMVKREANRIKQKRTREREEKRIAAAREIFPQVREAMATAPHPNK